MWLPQRGLGAVLTPDQRGFGGAPLPDGATPDLAVAADDVAALLDSRGLDRVVLGGLSMGGYVAMAFLRRYADRVAGLILADTKAGADTAEAATNRLRVADAVTAAGSARDFVAGLTPKLVADPDIADTLAAEYGDVPAPAVAWAQRAMAARPDSFDVLSRVSVPALVVVGEQDQLTPASDAEAMASALPGATLVRVPAAGHLSNLDAPEAFNDAVRSFLTRV